MARRTPSRVSRSTWPSWWPQDRIEIIGGAFYEPILAMIPRRDRIGQIRRYSDWLEAGCGCKVRGMWIPERVWEQSLTSDLVEADIQYTVLDDFHFRNAGLARNARRLFHQRGRRAHPGHLSGQRAAALHRFPLPRPEATIDHLRIIAERRPEAVVVFGDDGEKFGTWPETKKHVYEDGWLARFFDALVATKAGSRPRPWPKPSTTSAQRQDLSPRQQLSRDDRMGLADRAALEYERVRHDMEHDPRWPVLSQFVRGGFWRNFKVKYPEADEMYTRMLMVSRRVAEAERRRQDRALVDAARSELYRGQCNCSYWHGAFGGIYLPHLRNAVYRSLIAADNLLDRAAERQRTVDRGRGRRFQSRRPPGSVSRQRQAGRR